MLVAVLVVFVLCWTPQQAMLLWDTFSVPEKVGTVTNGQLVVYLVSGGTSGMY